MYDTFWKNFDAMFDSMEAMIDNIPKMKIKNDKIHKNIVYQTKNGYGYLTANIVGGRDCIEEVAEAINEIVDKHNKRAKANDNKQDAF